jgi:5-hydroxyisourate hydrolase-like protein (transthyretin family)
VETHSILLTSLSGDTDIYFEVISVGRTTAYDAFRVFRTLGLTDDTGDGTDQDPSTLCPEGYIYISDTDSNGVDGGEGVVCILDTTTDDDSLLTILFGGTGDGADPLGFIVEDLRTTVEEAGPVAQTTGVVATVVTTTGSAVGLGALVVTTAALLKTTAAVYNSVTSLGGLGSSSLGIPAAIKFLGITLTNILSNLGFIRKRKRRKEKTIGLVFDTVTGKPVNGVYLTFYSESGNLKSAISNKDGRYTTQLQPGDYKLSIHKEGYQLATKESIKQIQSEYPSIHHQGSDITITKQPFVNIAVPVTKTQPSTTTQKVLSLPKRLQGGVEKHSVIFLTISFIISGYAYIANPNLLNNTVFYLVLLAGVIQIIGSIIKSRTWGVVKTKDGKVIPQATLELYSIQSTEKQPHPTKVTRGKDPTSSRLRGARESLYTTTQTDTHGRYQFTPENGNYILKTRDSQGKITTTQEVTVTDSSPRVEKKVEV